MKPLKVFIIQPFGARYSDRFRDLVTEVCADEGLRGAFQAFHAIEEPSSQPRLQDRIDGYLKKADLCIADLAGVRNENALLEVGAAYALGIPVIPFSDKDLPADIRGNLYAQINLERLSEEGVERDFRDILRRRLNEARREIGTTKSSRFLSHAYENRGVVDFYSLFRRCEKRLYILTTNLNYIVNEDLDCGPDADRMSLLEIVALDLPTKADHFQIRILALDPDSNFTNERASSLGRDRQSFREKMRQDLDDTRNFIESEDCSVSAELKIYDAYPLQMTFFFDDYVVSSVVASSISSRYCVTYMHRLSELGAHQSYEQHFDNLWGKADQYAISQAHAKHSTSWNTRIARVHSIHSEAESKDGGT